MTKDTTFKEFVEDRGIDFTQLVYNSNKYRELARQFNEAKLELVQENPASEACQEVDENENV